MHKMDFRSRPSSGFTPFPARERAPGMSDKHIYNSSEVHIKLYPGSQQCDTRNWNSVTKFLQSLTTSAQALNAAKT